MDLFGNSRIGKLRVYGSETDTPALRLAVSTQIAALDIRSPAMPPASILVVKKMNDPDPGGIGSDNRVSNLNRRWESALNGYLDDAYYAALAPQYGLLPADAGAVVFIDQAQLLACLLIDLASGQLRDHWWWQQMLQTQLTADDVSTQIRLTCSESIDSLPGAFEQLHTWRRVEPVLARLEARDAVAICLALFQSHNLPEWSDMLAVRTRIDVRALPTRVASISKRAAIDKTRIGQTSAQSAFYREDAKSNCVPIPVEPWTSWLGVGCVPGSLATDQRLLMGLALMLYRMPWVFSRKDFKQHVADWLIDPASNNHGYGVSSPTTGAATYAQYTFPDVPYQVNANSAEQGRRTGAGRQEKFQHRPPSDVPFLESAEVDRQPVANAVQDIVDDLHAAKTDAVAAEPLMKDSRPVESVATDQRHLSAGATLATELGGVLYLINLIEALEVPSRFERDWGLASRISRWALVDSLARTLLAADFETCRDDPIWELLAGLDDRNQGEAIGAEVLAPPGYATPGPWQTYLAGENPSYYWAAARGVLRLWSSAAYLLVEAPRDQRAPRQQAKFELQSYLGKRSGFSLRRRAFKEAPLAGINFECGGDLRRWLIRVTPVLQRYLELMLAREEDGTPFTITRLLRCPGQIYVTPTYIDFVTVLDQISLKARACGLDRDPGWLPQYARSVKFHFN